MHSSTRKPPFCSKSPIHPGKSAEKLAFGKTHLLLVSGKQCHQLGRTLSEPPFRAAVLMAVPKANSAFFRNRCPNRLARVFATSVRLKMMALQSARQQSNQQSSSPSSRKKQRTNLKRISSK
eukprot:g36975.t1